MAKVDQEKLLFEALLKKARESTSQGRLGEALTVYESILLKLPDNVQTLNLHGQLCMTMGRTDEAKRSLEKAARLSPNNPTTWFMLSMVQRQLGQIPKALESLEKSIRLRPSEPQYIATKAEMMMMQGNLDGAKATLDSLPAAHRRNPVVAGVFGKIAARTGREAEGIEVVSASLQEGVLPGPVRAMLSYVLADLYDRTGQYDAAMEALHLANAAKGAPYQPTAFEGVVQNTIQTWSRAAISTLPRPSHSSDRVVFLIGMPRSGMRVVEQILGAHPDVYVAGEVPTLNQLIRDQWKQMPVGLPLITDASSLKIDVINHHAVTYLNHMKSLSPHAKRVVDRMPLGFACLGYLQVLFPSARIVHITRDPLDTCLSCYFQNFGGYLPYTNNLHYLGHFYRQYQRLMQHWRNVIEMPMIEMSYESLVGDTESQVRRLLDFLDLPFNDGCLRSHDTRRIATALGSDVIRRPITDASVNRHRHYQSHLQPLQTALGLTPAVTG